MNGHVRAVLRKELREFRRNKMIVYTMAVVPVLFLLVPLASVLLLPADAPQKAVLATAGESLLLFLLVPVMIPTTIAAYSVVGEREQGTLEPTLTTPVSDRDLLLGKALACTAPAILVSWVLFSVFFVLVRLFANPRIIEAVYDTKPLAAGLLLVPGLAGFAIVVAMGISARSTDVRVAQQLSVLATIPAVVGVVVFSMGLVVPSVKLFAITAVIVGIVDILGWRLIAKMFDRERLISRSAGPT